MRRQVDTTRFERARRMLEIESEWVRVVVDDVIVEDAERGGQQGWRVSGRPGGGAVVVTARLLDETGFQVGFVPLDRGVDGWSCFVARPTWWNPSCRIDVAAFRPPAARAAVSRRTVAVASAAALLVVGLVWMVRTDTDGIRREPPGGKTYPAADARIIGRAGGPCTAIAVDGDAVYVAVKEQTADASVLRRLGRGGAATTVMRIPGVVQKLAVRGAAVYSGESTGVYYDALDGAESQRRLIDPTVGREPCGVEALVLVGGHVRWASESPRRTAPTCGRRSELHVASVSNIAVERATHTPGDFYIHGEYYDSPTASSPWEDLRILPRAAFKVPSGATLGTLAARISLMVVPRGKDIDVLVKQGTHDPKGRDDTYGPGWGCKDCRIGDMVVIDGFAAWTYHGPRASGLARVRAPFPAERSETWVFESLATNTPVTGLAAANGALYWCEESGVVSKHVWAAPFSEGAQR